MGFPIMSLYLQILEYMMRQTWNIIEDEKPIILQSIQIGKLRIYPQIVF